MKIKEEAGEKWNYTQQMEGKSGLLVAIISADIGLLNPQISVSLSRLQRNDFLKIETWKSGKKVW